MTSKMNPRSVLTLKAADMNPRADTDTRESYGDKVIGEPKLLFTGY